MRLATERLLQFLVSDDPDVALRAIPIALRNFKDEADLKPEEWEGEELDAEDQAIAEMAIKKADLGQ